MTWYQNRFAKATIIIYIEKVLEPIKNIVLVEVFDICTSEISNHQQPKEWLIDSEGMAYIISNIDLLTSFENAPKSKVTTSRKKNFFQFLYRCHGHNHVS